MGNGNLLCAGKMVYGEFTQKQEHKQKNKDNLVPADQI